MMEYFFGILGIIAWIIIAFWPARWAHSKGYNFFLFLVLSWFISFVLTLIVIMFLKDKTATPQSIADDAAVDAVLEAEMKKAK